MSSLYMTIFNHFFPIPLKQNIIRKITLKPDSYAVLFTIKDFIAEDVSNQSLENKLIYNYLN